MATYKVTVEVNVKPDRFTDPVYWFYIDATDRDAARAMAQELVSDYGDLVIDVEPKTSLGDFKVSNVATRPPQECE